MRSLLVRAYRSVYFSPVVTRARQLAQAIEETVSRDAAKARDALLQGRLRDLKVVGGPFRGMVYPSPVAIGSVFVPKLLGTYEMELAPHVEAMLASTSPDCIVDVGCAEGYYAVGLAMRCPGARVHAFDIDPAAPALLADLAARNGVGDRVHFKGLATSQGLIELARNVRAGIMISDCEGFERDLFTPALIDALREWHLIIETHSSARVDVVSELRERFAKTHAVTYVNWQPRRAADMPFALEDAFGSRAVLHEGRAHRNGWLVCRPLGMVSGNGAAKSAPGVPSP